MTKKSSNRPTFTDQEALLFHSGGRPGKLEVVATKPMATQRDLSLAYSPGVAVPVLAIAEDASRAYDYTTKGNFVAVITNGTAILGLGNRGAQAARRGGPPRLRGGAAPARPGGRPPQARSVRLARARPFGRPPLRALPVVPGMGRRERQRHLL